MDASSSFSQGLKSHPEQCEQAKRIDIKRIDTNTEQCEHSALLFHPDFFNLLVVELRRNQGFSRQNFCSKTFIKTHSLTQNFPHFSNVIPFHFLP